MNVTRLHIKSRNFITRLICICGKRNNLMRIISKLVNKKDLEKFLLNIKIVEINL